MILPFFTGTHCSFFRKIFFAATVATIIVATGLALLFIRDQKRTLTESLKKEGEFVAGMVSHNARLGVFTENSDLYRDFLNGIIDNPAVVAVSILNNDGKVLDFRERHQDLGRRVPPSDVEPVRKKLEEKVSCVSIEKPNVECWAAVKVGTMATADETFFLPVTPPLHGEKVIGYVRVVLTRKHLDEKVRSLILHSALLTVGLLAVATAMLFVVIRKLVAPLNRLTEKVIDFGAGVEPQPVEVETKDEIGKLASAFNLMTEALARREEEKRKLEEQLRHSSKMEAIGTLAGGVAHDFNNILTAMVGYINILRRNITTDPAQMYLDRLAATTTRAASITKRLLALGRGDIVTLRPANLNDMIRGSEEILTRIAGESIHCEFALAAQPVIVMADPTKLEQVLLNLVSNARDAMPKGGMVRVRVGSENVDEQALQGIDHARPGDYGTVTISDSGTGIEDGIRDKIFDPFFTTKEVDKGTGLGLSMAYGIVKKHHGFIGVDSEIGRGTSFTIYLPVALQMTERNTFSDGTASRQADGADPASSAAFRNKEV